MSAAYSQPMVIANMSLFATVLLIFLPNWRYFHFVWLYLIVLLPGRPQILYQSPVLHFVMQSGWFTAYSKSPSQWSMTLPVTLSFTQVAWVWWSVFDWTQKQVRNTSTESSMGIASHDKKGKILLCTHATWWLLPLSYQTPYEYGNAPMVQTHIQLMEARNMWHQNAINR